MSVRGQAPHPDYTVYDTYPCYSCGKPMEHLCADIFTCENCTIIISEINLIKKLQSSTGSAKDG